MQLEELQQQWQRLDAKFERTLKLESELLRLAVTRPVRRRINRLAFWPALDIVLSLGILLWSGSFVSAHWNTSSLVVPAGIVMVAAILLMIDSIRQLVLLSEVDWSGKVVDIQSSLARLRFAKVRQFKWLMLFSPLVGFCGLIVGLQWLLDRLPAQHFVLDKLNPWWVASNYFFGVLFILFGHLIARFLSKRFACRGWWQHLLDGISGRSINDATAELRRWNSLDSDV